MVTRSQYSFLPSSLMKILFCSLCLLFSFSCFPRKIQASSETQFNTLDIGSQLSTTASTCDRRPFIAGLKKNTLELVNGFGPCAQEDSSNQTLNIISLADILAHDQHRVKSIQDRVVTNTNQSELRAVLGFGNYTVTFGLGTPKQNVTLIFDTASDVTWTQCQPCTEYCFPQKEPLFKPSASKTYSEIPCNSTECALLGKYNGAYCSDEHKCLYGADYGDGSYTTGIYSNDTLTLTPETDVFPSFKFGCGKKSNGSFGKASGLLGLSSGPVSFVSQTANKFARIFAYCLPTNIRSTGFLRFGNNNNNKTTSKVVVYTPLVPGPAPPKGYPSPTLYYIEITGISVGGKKLPINESVFKTKKGTIIDTGTMITRLPPVAYNATRMEFKKQMRKLKYKEAGAYAILDTCFDISRHAKNMITKIPLPTMSITFRENATVHLAPSGVVWVVNSTLACLAFAGNNNTEDLVIFGNTQQRKLEVMYDVGNKTLGFLPNPKCVSE